MPVHRLAGDSKFEARYLRCSGGVRRAARVACGRRCIRPRYGGHHRARRSFATTLAYRLVLACLTGFCRCVGGARIFPHPSALACAWRLPCDNRVKEPLWRLAVDAIPGSRFRPWTCPCLASSPSSSGRQHSFWDCPVAVGVRAQLSDARLPGGAVPAATQAAVWLLQTPTGGANTWPAVALCATAAM